jgi:hypothetical protein
MGAAARTTKPVTTPCDFSENQLPTCLLSPESALEEASLRTLLDLFGLLDRWDLEGKDHEE